MNTTYNKLVAKMLSISEELEKEVKELKFGCQVSILTDDSDYYGKCKPVWTKCYIIKVSPKKAVFDVLWHYPNSEIDYRSRLDAKELKIIGRDLTLEDVLRVLDNNTPKKIIVSIWDNYALIGNPGTLNNDAIKYKLGVSLQNQEEDTLKKLLGILN